MVQWVKVLATKPKDLSSIPRTHIANKRTNFSKVSFDTASQASARER